MENHEIKDGRGKSHHITSQHLYFTSDHLQG